MRVSARTDVQEGRLQLSVRQLVIILLALALAMFSLVTGSARADDGPPSEDVPAEEIYNVEVPLTLDCGALQQEAADYAVANGHCPAEGETWTDEQAAAVAAAVCGRAGFTAVRSPHFSGFHVVFSYLFVLNEPAIYRFINIAWANQATGRTGSLSDNGFMASSEWSGSRTVLTGAGPVTGSMGAMFILWWGGTCSTPVPLVASVPA